MMQLKTFVVLPESDIYNFIRQYKEENVESIRTNQSISKEKTEFECNKRISEIFPAPLFWRSI